MREAARNSRTRFKNRTWFGSVSHVRVRAIRVVGRQPNQVREFHTGRVATCPVGSTLTIMRSPARCRTAESPLWLSSAQPCIVQLPTAPSSRRRRSAGAMPPLGRRASSTIRITSATARTPSSTHTHAGVSPVELELEVVVAAGRMTCLVVVCSTVAVVNTVVGSDVVSVVVSGIVVVSVVVVSAASTPPASVVATSSPAERQAARPATCTGFLIPRRYVPKAARASLARGDAAPRAVPDALNHSLRARPREDRRGGGAAERRRAGALRVRGRAGRCGIELRAGAAGRLDRRHGVLAGAGLLGGQSADIRLRGASRGCARAAPRTATRGRRAGALRGDRAWEAEGRGSRALAVDADGGARTVGRLHDAVRERVAGRPRAARG